MQLGTWKINSNGYEGELTITAIDAQGKLNGIVFGNPIFGYWDEVANKIMFMRLCEPHDPSSFQVYTGYRIKHRHEGPDTPYTLTGFYEKFNAATAQRVVYGWFAHITELG